MGSSGSGNLSDYSGAQPATNGAKAGGSSGNDNCAKAFSTELEEVARCDFFVNNGHVPGVGIDVVIVLKKRLEVHTESDILIGYLPTKYNYLAACIKTGYQYTGIISASSDVPIPFVNIDIEPNEP